MSDRDKWRHRGEQIRDITWPLAAAGVAASFVCVLTNQYTLLRIMGAIGWICFVSAVLYIGHVTKRVLDAEEIFHKYGEKHK